MSEHTHPAAHRPEPGECPACDLAACQADRAALLDILREVEWKGDPHGRTLPVCPACGGITPHGSGRGDAGHRDGCRLCAALAPSGGRP